MASFTFEGSAVDAVWEYDPSPIISGVVVWVHGSRCGSTADWRETVEPLRRFELNDVDFFV